MVEKEIRLDREVLVYEVENVVSKVSRARLRDDNLEQCIEVQADETEQDRAIVTRGVEKAINTVRSRVSAYIQEGGTGDEVIRLVFPDGWRASVFGDLVGAVEGYIINVVVYEWLRITMPQEAQFYGEEAEENYGKIKSCITARVAGSVYRPLQPF